MDPLTKEYPMLTPYQFASNRPIDGIDLDGAEYLDYKAALGISIYQKKEGTKIKKISYGYVRAENLPAYYKSMGIKTQAQIESAIKNTQAKLDQLNPPDFPAKSRAEAVESMLQWVAKEAVEMTPEVKAYEEMKHQVTVAKMAISLTEKATSMNLMSPGFENDDYFQQNVTNYLLDGSLTASGMGEKLAAYNNLVVAVGTELFSNKDKIIAGTYKRPSVEVISTNVTYVPRSLDFQNYSAPKVALFDQKTRKVDPPYKAALDAYNKASGGCTNCNTISAGN